MAAKKNGAIMEFEAAPVVAKVVKISFGEETVKDRLALGRRLRDEQKAKREDEPRPDQGFKSLAETVMTVQGPRIVDKRKHLTLVQAEYLYQTGQLPRDAWECFNYLYQEAIHFGWANLADIWTGLMRTSQAVEGFGSNQLVKAMSNEKDLNDQPARLLGGERDTQGLRRN